MELGKVVYSPDYQSNPKPVKVSMVQVRKLYEESACANCGTPGKFPMVKSYGGRLCPECKLEWKDYRSGF